MNPALLALLSLGGLIVYLGIGTAFASVFAHVENEDDAVTLGFVTVLWAVCLWMPLLIGLMWLLGKTARLIAKKLG